MIEKPPTLIELESVGSAYENLSTSTDEKYLLPGKLVQSPDLSMPLIDAIRTRRTVRSYNSKKVPFEVFQRIIDMSSHAPTACNEQRWKVIYIDDPEILNELYLRGSAAFIKKTKQAFLLLYNNRITNFEHLDHVQSASAFINTFSLISHSLGIGSCWVCHMPRKKELRKMFGIHKYYDPIAIIPFGYYKDKVKIKPRKRNSDNMISKNTFEFKSLNFSPNKNIYARRIFIYIYYRIPPYIRKKIRRVTLPYEKKFYNEVYD